MSEIEEQFFYFFLTSSGLISKGGTVWALESFTRSRISFRAFSASSSSLPEGLEGRYYFITFIVNSPHTKMKLGRGKFYHV